MGTSVAQGLLSTPIKNFFAQNDSPASVLVRLSLLSHVPFGIESIDETFAHSKINVAIQSGTLNEAYEAILGKMPGYKWEEYDGLILVRKTGSSSEKKLLEVILPRYWLRRRATLPEANNLLVMTLQSQLNPNIGGFAGTFAEQTFPKLLEPCDLRDVKVRSVIAYLVRSSGAPGWIATVPEDSQHELPPSGLWKIIPPDETTAQNTVSNVIASMRFSKD
jgi:hypothetical protein